MSTISKQPLPDTTVPMETPGPGLLWEIINYDKKLGYQTWQKKKNSSFLTIISELFSFSVDESLFIGISCAIGFLLCCTRGFGLLSPIGCVEEGLW